MIQENYPDGRIVKYTYTGDGSVHSILETGGDSPAAWVYDYDTLGRLIGVEKRSALDQLATSSFAFSQDFDAANRVSSQAWNFAGNGAYANTYTYNNDNGTLTSMNSGGVIGTSYVYDNLLRLSNVNSEVGVAKRAYTYRTISGNRTSNQVTKLNYTQLKGGYYFDYTYDNMGNIKEYTVTCTENSGYSEPKVTYDYDIQGQLTSATGGSANYSYTYDAAGNILSANKGGTNHTYSYNNADWKDLLTHYDGQQITYDNAGNPTSYYNGTRWTFTWGNGRRLETATNGTVNASYNYMADGTRTSKVVDGVTHTYYYSGNKLLRETYGSTVLDFFYDANGTPIAMKQNGAVYYYITNLQGDVVRLVNAAGNTAAWYKYDPYGNATTASGSHATINPLRYRGYYYDTETGLYYCQSRYYDPTIGRFINADAFASTGQGIIGHNMFAYCGNNPIYYIDNSGTRYEYSTSDLGGGWNYIYNQAEEDVGEKSFGISTISSGGCGVVATYNALLTLGVLPNIDEIIQYYEQNDDLLFGGLAGLPYTAVADYFEAAGYEVSMHTEPELFNYYMSQSDAAIMWYTWASAGKIGMHFFHADSTARLNRGYNVFSNDSSVRYLPSNVSDIFPGSDSKYCVIICINRR